MEEIAGSFKGRIIKKICPFYYAIKKKESVINYGK